MSPNLLLLSIATALCYSLTLADKCCPPDHLLHMLEDQTPVCVRHFDQRAVNTSCNNPMVKQDVQERVVCRDQDLLTDGHLELVCPAFRKCCPSGQDYDSRARVCATSNRTEGFNPSEVLREDGLTEIVYGVPRCNGPLIEFSLKKGSKMPNRDFDRRSVCVDRVGGGDEMYGGRKCVSERGTCGVRVPCIRKCCPPGRNIVGRGNRTCSLEDTDRGFNPSFYEMGDLENPLLEELEYGILHGDEVCDTMGKYLLKMPYYLMTNGKIYVPRHPNKWLTTDEYCLDDVNLPARKMDGIYVFACFKKEHQAEKEWQDKFVLIAVGLIVSSIFLLATLLVYALLPSLQNLHGMTLMSHVASFLLAFLCLATIQIGKEGMGPVVCPVLGFILTFAFLASFAWMNMMCFDIWWTFGGVRSVNHITRKQRERRRFALYSLYGWGLPCVITSIAVIMDYVEGLAPAIIKPDIGIHACWFPPGTRISYSRLVFFSIPISLLIICNVVLFILTAISCSKVKAEINRMQANSDERCKKKFIADKNKLMMNGKLFIVMGVTWVIEMITLIVPNLPPAWTLIPDAFNTLQGILIFSIFVLKPKVLNALAERFGIKRKKKPCQNLANQRLSCLDPLSPSRKISASSTCFTTTTSANDRGSPARLSH